MVFVFNMGERCFQLVFSAKSREKCTVTNKLGQALLLQARVCLQFWLLRRKQRDDQERCQLGGCWLQIVVLPTTGDNSGCLGKDFTDVRRPAPIQRFQTNLFRLDASKLVPASSPNSDGLEQQWLTYLQGWSAAATTVSAFTRRTRFNGSPSLSAPYLHFFCTCTPSVFLRGPQKKKKNNRTQYGRKRDLD